MNKAIKFTEADLDSHKILDELLSKNVNWSGNTQEMIKIYRSLVWFSQLKEKIKGNIFQIEQVKQYNKTDKDS